MSLNVATVLPQLLPKLETATGLQLLEKACVKVIELINILGNDAP